MAGLCPHAHVQPACRLTASPSFPIPAPSQRLAGRAAELHRALEHGSDGEKTAALREIGAMADADAASPLLDDLLAAPDTLPLIVDLLARADALPVQHAASFVLRKLAGSPVAAHRRACMAAAPAPLVRLLRHAGSAVCNNAAGMLAVLADMAPAVRDSALAAGALQPLADLMGRSTPQEPARMAAAAVRALCGGEPAPPLAAVAPALPALSVLIKARAQDEEVLEHALVALSSVASCGMEGGDAVAAEPGLLARAVGMLVHPAPAVNAAAAALLYVVAALGSDARRAGHARAIIDARGVPLLARLLSHAEKSTRKMASGTLAKLAAAGPEASLAPALPALAALIQAPDQDADVLTNAMSAIASMAVGTEEGRAAVMSSGVLPHCVRLLAHEEADVCAAAALVMQNTALSGEGARAVIAAGAPPFLARLICNRADDVRVRATAAVGNIALSGLPGCNAVLAEGALHALVAQLAAPGNSVAFTTAATHTLNVFCSRVPKAAYEVMLPALPLLVRLIQAEGQNVEVLGHCLDALASMAAARTGGADAVLGTGVLPRTVQLLTHAAFEVRHGAAATVGHVAGQGAAHKEAVVAAGAVPHLVRLITAGERVDRLAAMAALANIASGPGPRDAVLAAGMLPALLAQLAARGSMERAHAFAFTHAAARALRNLCGTEPRLPFRTLAPALPALAELVLAPELDDVALVHATMAVAGLAAGSAEGAAAVAGTAGIARRAVQLLSHEEADVCAAAAGLVGALSVDDGGWRRLMQARVLPALRAAMLHPATTVRVRAFFAMENVLSRGPGRIQDVVDARLLPLLVRLLGDGEPIVRTCVAFGVRTLAEAGSPAQVRALVAAGALPPLVRLLGEKEGTIFKDAMAALQLILAAGKAGAAEQGEAGAAERGDGAAGRAANAYAEAARAAGAEAALAAVVAAGEGADTDASATASAKRIAAELLREHFE